MVAAMEVGGRWSAEAADFLCELAHARAAEVTAALRGSAYTCYKKRWAALVSVAAHRTFADTLLHGTAKGSEVWRAANPTLGEVLGEEAYAVGSEASELPLRG